LVVGLGKVGINELVVVRFATESKENIHVISSTQCGCQNFLKAKNEISMDLANLGSVLDEV